MHISTLLFEWRDLADPQVLAAALLSAATGSIVGAGAARRLRLPQLRSPAALIGVGATVLTLMPSMIIFGSLSAGLYALSAHWLPIENRLAGKEFVVIGTALGCGLAAWVPCLFLLAAPAIVGAAKRRADSP